MLRSYRHFIIAAFLGLALTSPGQGQAPRGGNEITQKAQGRADGNQDAAAKPASLNRNKLDREKAGQPDCGTPKECRAEQREKDDLVAQQSAAKAATDQASLARWQTLIATIGVIAIIATLIYTHMATRSAIRAVEVMTQAEKAMLSIHVNSQVFQNNGTSVFFTMCLSNVGRTVATLIETNVSQSSSNNFADFKAENVKKHNLHILSAAAPCRVDQVQLFPQNEKPMFIVGYYKWTNQFENREYCDHFCCPVQLESGSLKLGTDEGIGWPADSV